MGPLYAKKMVDKKIFTEILAPMVVTDWPKMEPLVIGVKKLVSDPKAWEYFEYLAREMQREI